MARHLASIQGEIFLGHVKLELKQGCRNIPALVLTVQGFFLAET